MTSLFSFASEAEGHVMIQKHLSKSKRDKSEHREKCKFYYANCNSERRTERLQKLTGLYSFKRG